MKISVILAHPHPGSFNHVIADEATATLRKSGHAVFVHDLYQEKFDPGSRMKRFPVMPRSTRQLAAIAGRSRQRTG